MDRRAETLRTGAIIVAAGRSSRMDDFKPMMQIGSISIIQRVIATLSQAGVDPVVIITGYNGKLLERHLSKHNVLCIHNPDYESTEMFDSARLGMKYLKGKCDRILFTPADIPLFTVNTVRKLLDTGARLAKPVMNGKGGHPILIDASLIPGLLKFSAPGGMKAALQASRAVMERIEVEDEGILLDADTQEDYQKLLSYHNEQLMQLKIRLILAKETEFLDDRGAMLLHLIHENNSIRHACEQVNISYRKGFNLINRMEQQMGMRIVRRQQGGIEGGYSELTEEGMDLLNKYDALLEEATAAVHGIYERIFGKNP